MTYVFMKLILNYNQVTQNLYAMPHHKHQAMINIKKSHSIWRPRDISTIFLKHSIHITVEAFSCVGYLYCIWISKYDNSKSLKMEVNWKSQLMAWVKFLWNSPNSLVELDKFQVRETYKTISQINTDRFWMVGNGKFI